MIPVNEAGELVMGEYAKLLASGRVSDGGGESYFSNSLGTINPVAEMIRMAHGGKWGSAGAD